MTHPHHTVTDLTMIDHPTQKIDSLSVFGIQPEFEIYGFAEPNEHVPSIDSNYCFDADTTLTILAGLMMNRRVLIQGYHGTGKSTHIEQIAARLCWPCIRINLDSHITRTDLIGRDTIVVKDGHQISEFQEGFLPWSIQRPCLLVFDEYDAARPDVMFVIQRVLENEGKFTLLDQGRVITPHPWFRLFATMNTHGTGDKTGLYHGTNPINQGQMDRWNLCVHLDYLPFEKECEIILSKLPQFNQRNQTALVHAMVHMANLTRQGFILGDLSNLMSLRTVLNWGENILIFNDVTKALKLTYLNKCEDNDQAVLAEFYQRCFGQELPL